MDWLSQLIQDYLPLVSDNRMIQGSLIILIGAIFSGLAKGFINKIQLHATSRTANLLDDQFFELLKKPFSLSILLVAIYLGVIRSELVVEKLPVLKSILVSVAVFYWLRCFLSGSKFALKHLSHNNQKVKLVQKHTLPLFENLAVLVLYAVAVYFLFVAWSIDVTAWVASAGILGLALSFAAKDTLANLFAGVFILADTPYRIGDFIVLDSGERGLVTHIGIRSTRILTRSDVEITIPNAIMGNTKVTNETAGPHSKYRLRLPVGVAYGSDIPQVRVALLKVASENSQVESFPEPRVRMRSFGDSSLNFELLCWVAEPVLRGLVSDLLLEGIYDEFNQENIEIPFPQRDVNLKQ